MGGPSDARSSHRARPPCEEPCIYALNDISFVLKYKFLGIDTWTDVSLTFSITGGSFKHNMEQLPESDCFLYDKCRFKINYSVTSEITDTRILCPCHFSDSDKWLLHNAGVTGEDCSFSYSAGSTFPRDAPASHHALLRLFSSCLRFFFIEVRSSGSDARLLLMVTLRKTHTKGSNEPFHLTKVSHSKISNRRQTIFW